MNNYSQEPDDQIQVYMEYRPKTQEGKKKFQRINIINEQPGRYEEQQIESTNGTSNQ